MTTRFKETAYKLLDILTFSRGIRVKINDFRLRLPTRYHRYFPAGYEAENFAFLKQKATDGGVVIDIGAHIGLFAVRAAQLIGQTGRVYAFEPTPATHLLLQKTVAVNEMQYRIMPQKEAIADEDGETFFYVSDNEGDNANSLVNYRIDRGALHKVTVKQTSIDNFLQKENLASIDFIKIDAEGFEYKVLLGCKNLFTSVRPFGILALHPKGIRSNGDSLEEIYDFLESCNYDVVYNKSKITKTEFCIQNDLFDVHLSPKDK